MVAMTTTAPLSLVTVGGSGLDGMPARRGGGREEEGRGRGGEVEGERRDCIKAYHNTYQCLYMYTDK